jgi:hypothetical protein
VAALSGLLTGRLMIGLVTPLPDRRFLHLKIFNGGGYWLCWRRGAQLAAWRRPGSGPAQGCARRPRGLARRPGERMRMRAGRYRKRAT